MSLDNNTAFLVGVALGGALVMIGYWLGRGRDDGELRELRRLSAAAEQRVRDLATETIARFRGGVQLWFVAALLVASCGGVTAADVDAAAAGAGGRGGAGGSAGSSSDAATDSAAGAAGGGSSGSAGAAGASGSGGAAAGGTGTGGAAGASGTVDAGSDAGICRPDPPSAGCLDAGVCSNIRNGTGVPCSCWWGGNPPPVGAPVGAATCCPGVCN
jgi:hypothetical protein